jgi:cell division protein FtsL
MTMILGIAMIYAWIHSTVIIFKKVTGLTQYEKAVMWFALVVWALFLIGYLSK